MFKSISWMRIARLAIVGNAPPASLRKSARFRQVQLSEYQVERAGDRSRCDDLASVRSPTHAYQRSVALLASCPSGTCRGPRRCAVAAIMPSAGKIAKSTCQYFHTAGASAARVLHACGYQGGTDDAQLFDRYRGSYAPYVRANCFRPARAAWHRSRSQGHA